MNETALSIYLGDHLAAMTGECELVARVAQENENSPWNGFLRRYQPEVKEQYVRLETMIEQLGYPKSALKEAAGWLLEKVGRLKLNDRLTKYSPLSRLVEFEALIAAAQLRYCLWKSLETAQDPVTQSLADYAKLREQAERHLEQLADEHRRAADLALRIPTGPR